MRNKNTEEYWNKKLSKISTSRSVMHKRILLYRFLIQFLGRNKEFSLLDVGCGLGLGLVCLAQHCPQAHFYGLDFSSWAITRARARYRDIKFLHADIRFYEFTREFDYITIVRTLEHLENPFGILDKCLEVSPMVFVSVPKPGTFCTEHITEFEDSSFDQYEIKELGNPKGIHGQNLAIYGKKEQAYEPT